MDNQYKAHKFWDKLANRYDQYEKSSEQTYTKIIVKTKKYLKIDDEVLDFGCGTGLISNEIAENVKVIHAIDTSSKMLENAQKKANVRKIQNIKYTQTTIFDERFKQGSIDVILVCYILHLLEDIETNMQRLNELLKPGGFIISVTPCLGEHKALLGMILHFFSKIGFIPKIRSFKISELERLITNGKFEIIESECLHRSGPQYLMVAKKL